VIPESSARSPSAPERNPACRPPDTAALSVADILAAAAWKARIELDEAERQTLGENRRRFMKLAVDQPVYGLTRGFGPLVQYPAHPDPARQAAGLLAHLSVGQGAALQPEVARTVIWLRLVSMRHGYSGVHPELWDSLACQWNAGYTPVIPSEGSLSASGDLVPLAHAAGAMAGEGESYARSGDTWAPQPAATVLKALGLAPVRWEARSALAFVNGTSVSLAVSLHAHARLAALTRAVAESTGRLCALLGASPEPYAPELAAVRGHPGHACAATWIRSALGPSPDRDGQRPLQEPYSLRCVPQVLGAIIDQLRVQGEILATEAAGCTDNPILADGAVLHGGNFHAAPVGLAAEQLSLCAHQLAYLAERQLALLVDPQRNGGRPPMLTPWPGRASGLAGVQIAASSFLAAIRQHAYPASLTPVPSNLGNQDHVPMALNAANALEGIIQKTAWIIASVYLGVNQLAHLGAEAPHGPAASPLWNWLRVRVPALADDRPLAQEVREVAARIEHHFGLPLNGDWR
jgi:histidine ammonia-lyase